MGGRGTGIETKKVREYNVEIDGRDATFDANIPDEKTTHEDDVIIYTNPAHMLKKHKSDNILPSLSLIRFAKIKNFIDGVYAKVEENVMKGGHEHSRTDFLLELENKLEDGLAKDYIRFARLVGEGKIDAKSQYIKDYFDEPEFLPQGFYLWNEPLSNAYGQIKALSKLPEELEKQKRKISAAIKSDDDLKSKHDLINSLYQMMTNEQEKNGSLFPPAKMPDQKFFVDHSIETQSDIPEGLGKALVKAIKDGLVKFTPDKKSGLYIYQMHELTPLISRDSYEFEKYHPNKNYKSTMENEFISQWAATRHTHVAHFDHSSMVFGCSIKYRPEVITIKPEFYAEPFPTIYERMRNSLEFLEKTIISAFSNDILDEKRVMHDGSRSEKTIGEEFENTYKLLDGLRMLSLDSLHIPYEYDKKGEEAIKTALSWFKNAYKDPDLDRNVAIFVPIIRETSGEKQIAYIDAGYRLLDLDIKYDKEPKVEISPWVSHKFEEQDVQLPALVHKEVRIPYKKMINDKKLREVLSKKEISKAELDTILARSHMYFE